MISLISPAKSLNFNDDLPFAINTTTPQFQNETADLVNQLKRLEPEDFEKLMHISPKLAQGVFEMYVNFKPQKFDHTNSKPALFAFNGDVYKGLDAKSLTPSQFEFANDHLLMLSGLYGFLRPADLMQAYRLEMGTKFTIDNQVLAHSWKQKLTARINELLDKHSSKIIVNLASKEYAAAIDHKAIKGQWRDIEFKEYRDGKYKIIALLAKRARGRMVRFILEHNIDSPEALQGFDYDGYGFNPELSNESTYCFTRQS
ncbi:MAG: peroxide stress protein YaaA [Francisellaceae bacterium]